MFNYDNKNDAHKLSNYDEWKKTSNIVTEVEIDLSNIGVPPKKVEELYKGIVYCLKTKTAFALFTDDGEYITVIVPEYLSIKQGLTRMKYGTEKQLLNAIKLILLTHHNIQIHEKKRKRLKR